MPAPGVGAEADEGAAVRGTVVVREEMGADPLEEGGMERAGLVVMIRSPGLLQNPAECLYLSLRTAFVICSDQMDLGIAALSMVPLAV